MDGSQRGLSARHLVLFFLAGVAVCGVFFALGFLVGYNQRPAGAGGVETERLVSSGAVPPTVNPSPGSDKPVSDNAATGGSATGDGAASSPAGGTDQANPPGSAKPKRGGSPAPEVSETNLEQEEIGHPAGASTPAGAASPGGEGEKKTAEGTVVQVLALRTRPDASHLVDVLKTHGYSAFLVTPEEAKAGDNLYRVEVGPFATRREAEKTRERLSGLGYKPFIRR